MKKMIMILCFMSLFVLIFAQDRILINPPFIETFTSPNFPPAEWSRYSGLLTANSILTPSSDVDNGWQFDSFGNAPSNTTNRCARANIYSSTTRYWLISPSVTLIDTVNYQLEFDMAYTSYGSTQPAGMSGADDRFAVVISTNNGQTWSSQNAVCLWNNTGSPYVMNSIPNTGQHFVFNISQYSGIVKIGFYAESTASNADNDLFIDNVQVRALQPGQGLGFNPDHLTYDDISINTNTNLNVTINSMSAGTIALHQAVIEGSDIFTLINVPALPLNILPSQSYSLTVNCAPTAIGDYNAVLKLMDSMNTIYEIPLSAHAVNYNSGGGDANTIAGGYWFINSIDVNINDRPQYNWIDPIAENHTMMTSWDQGQDGDTAFFTIPDLGFNFNFYGNVYRLGNVFAGSNGYISFGAGYTLDATDALLPAISEPNNMIALCVQDLYTDGTSRLYYKAYDNYFVITYWHFLEYPTDDYITAQAILYSNGRIKLQYNMTESSWPVPEDILNDMLIGIENYYGNKGICYRNDNHGGPFFSSEGNHGLAIVFSPNTNVDNHDPSAPGYNQITFLNPYPNPFNPIVNLSYSLAENTLVSLKIYNSKGQMVRILVNEENQKGDHRVSWNGRTDNGKECASGVYFAVISSGKEKIIKKVIMMK